MSIQTISSEGIDELGIPQLVAQLVDDAKDVARAELAVVRAKTSERFSAYGTAAIYLVIAGVLVLEAIGALLVGLIITLATKVGPGLATLIVVGTVLVVAGVLAWIGKRKLASPQPIGLRS